MGTIPEKLSYLGETKRQIADAIRAKKVTVPADATFREYAALIEQIDGGAALEPLDSPAFAPNIQRGYQAYSDKREVIKGTLEPEPTVYVPSAPVTFTLTDWDEAAQGHTYTFTAYGYAIGKGGLQIGLPSDGSTVNAQAVIEAALTIVDTRYSDGASTIPPYITATLSAVNVPTMDVSIALFGLEDTESAFPLTTKAIYGITPPATGQIPVTKATNTSQFTATVEWSPSVSDTFEPNTVYAATITVTPSHGYSLDEVPADFFTVSGASSVHNDAGSGIVTAVFPVTGNA